MKSRFLLAVPALALATAALTGCTSTSYSCSNNQCTVTLSGAGAETELLDDTLTVSLVGASDGQAEFAIDGTSATCAQGDEQEVAGYQVVCTEVGDDKVVLELA